MKAIDGRKGSITVEASIALPIFISVAVSIVFFIKVVTVHEIIQHGIAGAAHELSVISYMYHVSGLQEVHDTVRDGMKTKAEVFESRVATAFDAYKDLSLDDEAAEAVRDVIENPMEELKNIACVFAKGEFEDIKTEVCIPAVELLMQKYLKTEGLSDVDKRLRELNIADGFKGLDFSQSSFFYDENNDIDIIVQYKMNIPVPIKVFPPLLMVQRATVKAWLGDDSIYAYPGNSDEDGQGDDIWSLGNFQRGMKLRAIFGANLPHNFPGISKFDSGTATLIKSMDLTANTYQHEEAVRKKVAEYVEELAEYQGQEQPWGKSGIVIKKEDIRSRCLLLVIPKNPAAPGVKEALSECARDAAARGVDLRVVEYGYKKTHDQDRTSSDGGDGE